MIHLPLPLRKELKRMHPSLETHRVKNNKKLKESMVRVLCRICLRESQSYLRFSGRNIHTT